MASKLYCRYCGKEFFSEYGSGGYIDHVMNFSQAPSLHVSTDSERIINEITKHGNEYRSLGGIKARYECFLKWKDVPFQDYIQRRCTSIIQEVTEANKKVDSIVNSLNDMEKDLLKKRLI